MWLSQNAGYKPVPATDGYRAFVRENDVRLREKAKAQVYGLQNRCSTTELTRLP